MFNRDFSKLTLEQMLSLGIFKRIDQPPTVYHMTPRTNLDKIIMDGKIRTCTDYVCWFSTSIDKLLTYIELSNALTGRKHGDFDGKEHTAPAINPQDMVVLKLKPRFKEPLYWYAEFTPHLEERAFIDGDTNQPIPAEKRQECIDLRRKFDDSRICHYGDMKFKRDFEVIELAEILCASEMHKVRCKEGA